MLRLKPHILAVALTYALPLSCAWAQTAIGDKNIAPITPEPEVGLPDKVPVEEAPAVPSEPAAGSAASGRGPAPQAQAPAATATQPTAAPSATAGGRWTRECAQPDNCQAIVRASVGDQVALVFAVARVVGQPARFQLAVPLGVSVQTQVVVELGEYVGRFPVSRCTAQGCLVEAEAPQSLLNALESEDSGTATVFTIDDAPIQLPLPTSGFSEAFGSADSVSQ